MSIIGIDASRANGTHRTGVEWYTYHLLQALKAVIPETCHVILYSKEPLIDGLEVLPAHWESRVLAWLPRRLWTQVRLSWEMWRRPPDLLFIPAHTLPLVVPTKTLMTLHDVAFVDRPEAYTVFEQWYQRFAIRFAVQRAEFLTVSEFSKSEIVKYFYADPKKITVTPLGFDPAEYHHVDENDGLREKLLSHGIRRPYFLFVGRLESKKNIEGLLFAFRNFKQKRGVGDPVKLVLVGKRGVGYVRAMAMIANDNVKKDVIETGYIPQEDMAAIYSGAEALVFPSWYEGFGLPLLEAFACGTPVIASNRTSIPEVGGDAVLYVDPANPDTITRAMEKILNEPALKTKLVTEGTRRLENYDWKKTAELTWEVMKKILETVS